MGDVRSLLCEHESGCEWKTVAFEHADEPGRAAAQRELTAHMRDAHPFSNLSGPYVTVVADPPWQSNGNSSAFGAAGMARVARYPIAIQPESRYSTLPTLAICNLPVDQIVAKNAHLYLWATCSGLGDGLAVMEAWGFKYKTTLTWIKEGRIGLGAYFRTQTEHVLFGVRGALPTADKSQINYFAAAKAGHSVKPAAFGDLVERCSPGPYVELFARAPRLGWDSWGYGFEETRAG